MAVIHHAEIRPSKLEVLRTWAGRQPIEWLAEGEPEVLARSRLDDPAGEVGMEIFLLRGVDGRTVQVPLTYRGAPFSGGDGWLITTMTHTVLGDRWVYDAVGDPVFVATLATTIATGGREAAALNADGTAYAVDWVPVSLRGTGARGPVEPAPVRSRGLDPVEIEIGGSEPSAVTLYRRPAPVEGEIPNVLLGSWADGPAHVLAGLG